MKLDKENEFFANYFNSDDYKKFVKNEANKLKIRLRQFKKFNQKTKSDPNFLNDFIRKIIKKYNSIAYRDKFFNNGFEPPEKLFWELYQYAEIYGKRFFIINDNCFRYSLGDYVFTVIHGQGSHILVEKISDFNLEERLFTYEDLLNFKNER